MPWKLKIEPSRERVALIVIEKEVTLLGRRKVSEPAGDSAGSLRILMRIQGWVRDRDQRRGLIVAPVKSAQNPIEAWNLDSGANAGIGGILVHRASIMREPQPAVESKPACRFELILQENRFHVGPGDGPLWSDIPARPRVIHYRIELIVPLAKRLEASVEIVPSSSDAQSRNATYEV